MSFHYPPNIVTDGLVFYIDPFNFKSRDRSLGLTGGTIVDLTSSYGFEGDFLNGGPQISDDHKYMTFDGTDDRILFPSTNAESLQIQQPFYRYKPKTFTLSAWVKSGSTGAGVMFWGGGNDYFLKTPALTATTYTEGVYTGIVGENWSATTPTQASKDLPLSFEITVDSGGTITKAVAETVVGGSFPDNEQVIVRISGDTLGGTTPADDAYFLWRSATSSQNRWGLQIVSGNYSMFISDSIDKGGFNTDRVSNEPKEWNLITVLDEGQLVSGSRKCYVNGVLVNSSPVAPSLPSFFNGTQMNPGTSNSGQVNIGYGSSSSFGVSLDGSLGPCMMYDRALTPNEVLQNYNTLKSRYGL